MSARVPAVPASCKTLDKGLVERALVEAHGNVTAAARALSVPSADLRRLIRATPALAAEAYEAVELALDEAQAALFDGLRHGDLSRRLRAAAFFLRHSEAARRRGWGTARV